MLKIIAATATVLLMFACGSASLDQRFAPASSGGHIFERPLTPQLHLLIDTPQVLAKPAIQLRSDQYITFGATT